MLPAKAKKLEALDWPTIQLMMKPFKRQRGERQHRASPACSMPVTNYASGTVVGGWFTPPSGRRPDALCKRFPGTIRAFSTSLSSGRRPGKRLMPWKQVTWLREDGSN